MGRYVVHESIGHLTPGTRPGRQGSTEVCIYDTAYCWRRVWTNLNAPTIVGKINQGKAINVERARREARRLAAAWNRDS